LGNIAFPSSGSARAICSEKTAACRVCCCTNRLPRGQTREGTRGFAGRLAPGLAAEGEHARRKVGAPSLRVKDDVPRFLAGAYGDFFFHGSHVTGHVDLPAVEGGPSSQGSGRWMSFFGRRPSPGLSRSVIALPRVADTFFPFNRLIGGDVILGEDRVGAAEGRSVETLSSPANCREQLRRGPPLLSTASRPR